MSSDNGFEDNKLCYAKSEAEAKWLLQKFHVYIENFAGFVEFEDTERLANITPSDISFALSIVQRNLLEKVNDAMACIDGGLTKESLEEQRTAQKKAWLESLDAKICNAWVQVSKEARLDNGKS